MEIFSGILGLFLIAFLVLLGILWFILPFAIFGIKNKLNAALKEMVSIREAATIAQYEIRKTNQILKAVHNITED
jgi:hypothetical protein